MKRQEVEQLLKGLNLDRISLLINENDNLAVYCTLTSGVLKDYTGHVVDRKIDLWGYLRWQNGKPTRVPFGG